MRPERIAKHYVQTWFFFDIVVVIADWVFLLFGANAIMRIGKSNRITRIIRTVRLVRSIKLHHKLTLMMETIDSQGRKAMLNVALLAAAILIFNHYFACGWYFVAKVNTDGNNWVSTRIPDTSDVYKYATSLHWSLTQFTPAAMEIFPTQNNLAERVYSIVTLFFAMVTFSTFTASVTTNMTALRKLMTDSAVQRKILSDYFRQNSISAMLGEEVWDYIKQHLGRQRVVRSDIGALKLLPPGMVSKLNEELYVHVLKRCPFFFMYGKLNFVGLRHVCDAAISEIAVTTGEDLFTSNKPCDKLYFVSLGSLEYKHRDFRFDTELEREQWACEPALWMKWSHCGDLKALRLCQIFCVNAMQFRHVLTTHSRYMDFVRSYVKQFREWMPSAAMLGIWRTDVWLQADLTQIARVAYRSGFSFESALRKENANDARPDVQFARE